jgi:hypothetical protein
MAKLISIVIVKGTEPVNAVALSDVNAEEWLAAYDGTTVFADPEDDFGTDFITLHGCVAVDVTGLDPMPGVGSGWSYVKGKWVAPVVAPTVEPVNPAGV